MCIIKLVVTVCLEMNSHLQEVITVNNNNKCGLRSISWVNTNALLDKTKSLFKIPLIS